MYGIKYEISVSLGLKHICWMSGPWKGSASDPTIAIQSGLKEQLDLGEAACTDKIYKGDRDHFLCPLSGHRFNLPLGANEYNFLVYSARQSVERVIKRLRYMALLKNI